MSKTTFEEDWNKQLCDFYYSETLFNRKREQLTGGFSSYEIDSFGRMVKEPIFFNYFNDQLYTECIEHGHKPVANVTDAILIGSGYMNQTRMVKMNR